MPPFTLVGKGWHRRGLILLGTVLSFSLTAGVVITRDKERIAPNLHALAEQNAQLEQTRSRLEAMPPTHPIYWQINRLRKLARTLPGLSAFQAIEANPDQYSEAIAQHIGSFGGVVWKVAIKGSLLSVMTLCRAAQAHIPLLIDSIQIRDGVAQVMLFVLGAPATVRKDPP